MNDDGQRLDIRGIVTQKVYIKIQQRKGRKCWTIIEGLDPQFDFSMILKALKKDLCCNGSLIDDDRSGQIIRLQGDQSHSVYSFLVGEGIVSKDYLQMF